MAVVLFVPLARAGHTNARVWYTYILIDTDTGPYCTHQYRVAHQLFLRPKQIEYIPQWVIGTCTYTNFSC